KYNSCSWYFFAKNTGFICCESINFDLLLKAFAQFFNISYLSKNNKTTMKRTILLLFLAFHIYTLLAINKYPENPYQSNFEKAYQLYPNIPRGFLEAFAWHNTRIQKLDPNLHSCTGKPMNIGVLGLIYDGQN